MRQALAAAARVLTHITDATEGKLRRPRQAAVAIQAFWRTGRIVRSQWRHDQRFAEASELARAAVRLQALARGVTSRREAQAAKEAATTRASEARRAAPAGRAEGRSAAVRRAAEAVNMAAVEVQGYAWGRPLGWEDEALRRSTSVVGIQSAGETASSAFGPRRSTWYCGQKQMGAQGLRGSAEARKVPASKMVVAGMAKK